jgi:hypothetical protein
MPYDKTNGICRRLATTLFSTELYTVKVSLFIAIGRARKKKGLRLIDFHPRNVTKPDKSLFEFYEQSSVDFLCDLECCIVII